MKMLKQFTGLLLAAAAALLVLPAAAQAAEGQPRILLNASGVEGQYILRLEEFGSRFESVQFSIAIDRDVPAPQVAWEDDSPAHFQQIDTRKENGKTVLTVYIDRLRPIANSGSANLAALTFSQQLPSSAFSAQGSLLALDGNQEETLFQSPALSVSGVNTEPPPDPPASSGGSSSSSGSSSSGAASRDPEDSDDSRDGSPESSAERTVLRWEDVSSGKTSDIGGRKALTMRISSGQVISSQIFLQAQRQGLLLRLDYGDFVWIFDPTKGLDIPSSRVFYDLSVKPLHFRSLSAAVEKSDLVQFEITYSGVLPCPATLSYQAGSSYAGETVYLSYYNEKEASLDFRESAQVEEDGWVSFAFTHASRYVISQKDFWSAPSQPSAGAAIGAAASPVIVAPEDTVADAEQDSSEAAPEPEPEPEDTPSKPEEPEEDGEESVKTESRDTRDDKNVIPLLILFLSAAAAAILLLQMYTSKKRRHRR